MRAMDKLAIHYQGAELSIELDETEARLLINGLVRQRSPVSKVLLLSSTVQTDYEWHEYIEGIITNHSSGTKMVLYANNVQIAEKKFTY